MGAVRRAPLLGLVVLGLGLTPGAAEDAPWWAKFIPGYKPANATAAPADGGGGALPDWMHWIPKSAGMSSTDVSSPGAANQADSAGEASASPWSYFPPASGEATGADAGTSPSSPSAPASADPFGPPPAPSPAAKPSISPPSPSANAPQASPAPAPSHVRAHEDASPPSSPASAHASSIPENNDVPGLSGELGSTGMEDLPGMDGTPVATVPGLVGRPERAPSLPLLTTQAQLHGLGRGGELSSTPGLPDARLAPARGVKLPAEHAPSRATDHGGTRADRARAAGVSDAAGVLAAASLQFVDAPWAKFIPGATKPAPADGAASPAAAPSGIAGFMPYKPPPKPARAMPANVSGTWTTADGEAVALEARFVTVNVFLGGFMAAVQVSPWVPNAVLTLNYSDTDVVIQRLFNGDILDETGAEVGAFSLLTGKTGQAYIVRLHNSSVHSSKESPPDSFTFVASGTAQAPQMAVGCAWVDSDVLVPAGATKEALRYHLSPFTHPGGFLASVEVRPWVVGQRVTVDYGEGSSTVPTWWFNAKLLSAKGGKYTVQLLPFAHSDSELTPDSSFLIKATGSGSDAPFPTLSKAPASDADAGSEADDGSSGLSLLALSHAGGAAQARAGRLLAAAFAAGAFVAFAALAVLSRVERRPGMPAAVERALDGWRVGWRARSRGSTQAMLSAAILEGDGEEEAGGAYYRSIEPAA